MPPHRAALDAVATPSLNIVLSIRDDLQRYGLEGMLRSLREVADCHPFADLTSAVDAVRAPATDLLIVAPGGTDLDPDSVLHRVAAYGVRVLLLLPDLDSVDLNRVASLSGASLLCSEGLQVETLQQVLVAMGEGEVHIPAALTRALLQLAGRGLGDRQAAAPAPPRLTPREREALGHLVEGLSNKQIARRLHISEHGVKRLVASILAKLNCPNRTLATVRALREGLCAPVAAHPAGRPAQRSSPGGDVRPVPSATGQAVASSLTNGW
ncbi:helix-turn-helix transcriptional regulator [Streptomyces triticiradicis]|uniref:Response regulator transcription factor n=1 Tax=Streptomyces triticiradicis TaxID=2651189 RepID=A0A7J5DJ51_9ACTN|nr:response regulator transcription factor [Streptomyces triticiradicis]KAB1988713.1 response regulator transcription factor [Streptomyces triticiradicis]